MQSALGTRCGLCPSPNQKGSWRQCQHAGVEARAIRKGEHQGAGSAGGGLAMSAAPAHCDVGQPGARRGRRRISREDGSPVRMDASNCAAPGSAVSVAEFHLAPMQLELQPPVSDHHHHDELDLDYVPGMQGGLQGMPMPAAWHTTAPAVNGATWRDHQQPQPHRRRRTRSRTDAGVAGAPVEGAVHQPDSGHPASALSLGAAAQQGVHVVDTTPTEQRQAMQPATSGRQRDASHVSSARGARSGSGAPLSGFALMKAMTGCRSYEQLHACVTQHLHSFNHLHVACAMNRLAKYLDTGHPVHYQQGLALMATLEPLFVAHIPKYTVREVANAVWGWAKIQHTVQPATRQMVLSSITARDGRLLLGATPRPTPQALSNLAWGLATLRWDDRAAWTVLTEATQRALDTHQQLGRSGAPTSGRRQGDSRNDRAAGNKEQQQQQAALFAPVDVALLAWSYATARKPARPLLDQLASVAVTQVPDFSPQDLSNVLWGFASMRASALAQLVTAASPVVQARAHRFGPQALANVTWAYGMSGVVDVGVLRAVCDATMAMLAEPHAQQGQGSASRGSMLRPMHLNQVCWGLVRLRQGHMPLMAAIMAHARANPSAWNSRDRALLLYNLAGAGIVGGDAAPEHATSFSQLAEPLVQHLESSLLGHPEHHSGSSRSNGGHRAPPVSFVFQDLCQLAWAHARAGVYNARVFDLVAHACTSHSDTWLSHPAQFQTLLWSLGYSGHYHAPTFDLAATHLARLTPDTQLSPGQVASALVSLGSAQHYSAPACERVAAHFTALCTTAPGRVNSITLINALWGLTMLNYADEEFIRAGFSTLARRWQEQVALDAQEAARGTSSGPIASRAGSTNTVSAPPGSRTSRKSTASASTATGVHASSCEDGEEGTGVQPFSPAGDYLLGHLSVHEARPELEGGGLSYKQVAQVFQVCMWLQDAPGVSRELAEQLIGLLPEGLRAAGEGVWRTQAAQEHMVSQTQRDVHGALLSLGVRCDLEHLSADGLFSADIVAWHNGRRVLVEVNGPWHYSRTQPYRVVGSKVLRDRLVTARGYTVLNLPYWEWEAVHADTGKVADYLRAKLASVDS